MSTEGLVRSCPVGLRESDGDLWRCDKPAGHEGYHEAVIQWATNDPGSEPHAFAPARTSSEASA